MQNIKMGKLITALVLVSKKCIFKRWRDIMQFLQKNNMMIHIDVDFKLITKFKWRKKSR
jgi:hypothetical protein